MNIVLHIGTHKTGSTAIQYFMSNNRNVLETKGVLYPRAGTTNSDALGAHHALPWSLGLDHPRRDHAVVTEQVVRQILDEAHQSKAAKVIVSSEEFESVSDQSALLKLKELFAQLPVQVLVYLRRQDEVLLSAYNQRVKEYDVQFHGTIDELSRSQPLTRRLDYWALTQRWLRVFGEQALIVRRYDRERFPSGNVIRDFLTVLGVTAEGLNVHRWQAVNKSFHSMTLEILRRINKKDISRELRRALRDKVETQARKHVVNITVLSAAARREFLDRYRPSNERVARKWFPEANGVLFSEPSETGETPKDVDLNDGNQQLLIDMLIDSLIAAVKDLELRTHREGAPLD